MADCYLKVTYRHGKPFAAYLYLPRTQGDRVERSSEEGQGLVVDYAPDGRPIGIEILEPSRSSVERIHSLLQRLHIDALPPSDLEPICAA